MPQINMTNLYYNSSVGSRNCRLKHHGIESIFRLQFCISKYQSLILNWVKFYSYIFKFTSAVKMQNQKSPFPIALTFLLSVASNTWKARIQIVEQIDSKTDSRRRVNILRNKSVKHVGPHLCRTHNFVKMSFKFYLRLMPLIKE